MGVIAENNIGQILLGYNNEKTTTTLILKNEKSFAPESHELNDEKSFAPESKFNKDIKIENDLRFGNHSDIHIVIATNSNKITRT